MSLTIISNNCSGVSIYQDLGHKYESPTIALQILPDEYPRFCKDLKKYMSYDLKEYKDFSADHEEKMYNLLRRNPYFPVGIIGDVAVLFQHYKTFEEAKNKWDRRKARIDYNHICYFFTLEKKYLEAASEFGNLNLENSVLFTRDFEVDVPIEHYRYHLPVGMEFLSRSPYKGHRYFEGTFDREGFIDRVMH